MQKGDYMMGLRPLSKQIGDLQEEMKNLETIGNKLMKLEHPLNPKIIEFEAEIQELREIINKQQEISKLALSTMNDLFNSLNDKVHYLEQMLLQHQERSDIHGHS